MPNPENLKGHEFKPGHSGNPNGRPRKLVTKMKDEGYKRAEINDTIEALLAMTLDELEDVIANKDSTVLELAVAKSLKKSAEKGVLSDIETIISRAYGKPRQEVDMTSLGQSVAPTFNLSSLTTDELLTILRHPGTEGADTSGGNG